MKIILIALLSLGFAFSSCSSREKSAEENSPPQEINEMSTVLIEMEVSGMTCTGCENTIQNGVNELPGIIESDARHMEGITLVKADTSLVSLDEIAEMIDSKGYKVESAKVVEN